MCCHATTRSTKRFLASLKPGTKYVRGWKVVTRTGASWYQHYHFRPGVHFVDVDIEKYPYPCEGFHFYLVRPVREPPSFVVEVRVHPQDIFLADYVPSEPGPFDMPEAVATRIQIETRDWKRAGLPKPKPQKVIK